MQLQKREKWAFSEEVPIIIRSTPKSAFDIFICSLSECRPLQIKLPATAFCFFLSDETSQEVDGSNTYRSKTPRKCCTGPDIMRFGGRSARIHPALILPGEANV